MTSVNIFCIGSTLCSLRDIVQNSKCHTVQKSLNLRCVLQIKRCDYPMIYRHELDNVNSYF